MRITEESRFPHPVLSSEANDFRQGVFEVTFNAREKLDAGTLTLDHTIVLTEPAIQQLVNAGDAVVGCFVRCEDTYYTELLKLSWPEGRSDFVAGSLINRVTLQPIIWLEKPLNGWDPGSIHPEFEPPISLARGVVIAVGHLHVMSIGQAKFAALESIFELKKSSGNGKNQMVIDPDGDRIGILATPSVFEAIAILRDQTIGRSIVMNSVYLPAIMEVLALLSEGADQYSGHRWYQAFMAKCDSKGIDVTNNQSILEAAQTLLEEPMRSLALLSAESES